MDLLDQGRTTPGEGAVPAIGGGDEVVTQESIASWEAGRGNCRLPVGVQWNVGSQGSRNGSKVLVSEVLKRDRARRSGSGRGCARDCGGERERLAHDHR